MHVHVLVIIAVGVVLAIAVYYAFKNESNSLTLIADIDRLVDRALQSKAGGLQFLAKMPIGNRDVILEQKDEYGATQLRDIETGVTVSCAFDYKRWHPEYYVATRCIDNSVKALEEKLTARAMTNALAIKVKGK